MDPIIQKFRETFIEESVSLLNQLEKDLLELEKQPDNTELIESAFRAMHTIKGISGMYGFDFICEFTHSMESIYQAIRDHTMEFSRKIFDISFLSIDHIRKLLSDEKLADAENQSNHNVLLSDIGRLILQTSEQSNRTQNIAAESPAISQPHTWNIQLKANEQMHFRGISLMNIFNDLARLGRYDITRLDYISIPDTDIWSVILYTEASEAEIREVFMFIEDDCIFTPLTNRNLFESNICEEVPNEISILDYIELKDSQPGKSIENDQSESAENRLVKNMSSENVKQLVKRIPVDSEKLDHLMYLVSELITLNSRISLATRDEKFETLWPFTERLDDLSKLFRNNALDIRLVPLSETVLRFNRLIRDLSKHLNKKIELQTEGIDTELDKTTIDQLNEPLMHIIRNSIDHGIEMPSERVEKGKPETGVVRISASHTGNDVIIRVEDDGAGIDVEKIRRKAIDKGLLKTTDQPSQEDLIQMIFLPGFSTAQSLSEISGRGVGMDVVRRKIIDMHGEVNIFTELGKGTSFVLKLQQSVAIIDTLLFKVEDTHFTVPVSDINVCIQLSKTEIDHRKHTGTIAFDNQLIPYIHLRETFSLPGDYDQKIKAVIIKNNDRQVALLTDLIVGEHQAVLKPLGKLFQNEKCISAASQLGNGDLAFMLDTNELFIRTESNNH